MLLSENSHKNSDMEKLVGKILNDAVNNKMLSSNEDVKKKKKFQHKKKIFLIR
jgi:hypothetical protein